MASTKSSDSSMEKSHWNEKLPVQGFKDDETVDSDEFEEVKLESAQRKRPTLRKFCIIATSIVAVSLLACATFYSVGCQQSENPASHVEKRSEIETSSEGANASVCSTPVCVQYAETVKSNFAKNYKSIDPCQDFDTYTCGGFVNTHDYRPEQSVVSSGSVMGDTIKALLRGILEGGYVMPNRTVEGAEVDFDKQNFQKMKDAYQTCMNEDAIREYGVTPVKKLLTEFSEVFPRAGSALSEKTNDELTKAVTWLAKHSVAGLISADTGADDKNPDVVVIQLGASEISLGKEYYSKPATLRNLTIATIGMKHVLDTGKPIYESAISAEEKPALDMYGKNAVDFETTIANNIPEPAEASKAEYYYHPAKVSEVEKMVPEFSLSGYLKALVPGNYSITPDTMVIVSDINYYKNLSKIITSTPRETLFDYFQSRIISTWGGRLHRNFTLPSRQFNNLQAGKPIDSVTPRFRTCLTDIDQNLGYILGASFIEHAFSKEDKALGDRIIQDIRNIFSERFKDFDWMSKEVQDLAVKKVANLVQKVGYQVKNPDTVDPASVNKYYKPLKVTPTSSFYENGREYARFNAEKSWYALLKPVDRDDWSMTAPTVNAYYNPSGNEIVFPAGIMQIPVFKVDLPEFVNYGAFGAVAGHELTHAFDNHGSNYDERGVLRNWWDEKTRSNFEKKTQCFVDQYGNYTVKGPGDEDLHINGKLTLGENIADAGGLTASFRAWKQREKQTPNPKLPGLEEFTSDQMFFIAFGNWWCSRVRPAQKAMYIYTDPHSPAEKRILGTTANSAAFKEAFNCPNKEPVCKLW